MPSNDIEQSVDHALGYAEKTANRRATSFRNILAIAFSLLLLVGMVVCLICDIAISGKFTWSLYPISSILFAWVVMVPFVKCGRKGLLGSLVALSIFIIPFLYVTMRFFACNIPFLRCNFTVKTCYVKLFSN